jgi:hypothetical protein
MKLSVTKSQTLKKPDGSYEKLEYSLESEGNDPDVLRMELEGRIDEWLNMKRKAST